MDNVKSADDNIDKINLEDNSSDESTSDVVKSAMEEAGITDEANDELSSLQSIESQIKVNMARIGRLKEEMKPQREMLRDFLNNDETFMKLTDVAKKASQDKNSRKKQLLQEPNAKTINDKLDMMKEDLKEANEALSDYLRAYQEKTGLNEFEGEDGELRQIVNQVKLVRKTNINR